MATIQPVTARVSLTADTGTPTWLTHLLTFLLPVVAIVLAVWQPAHIALTAPAQAAIILGALIAAAALHAVHLVTSNGLTKAGLAKSAAEEESWLKANYDTLKTTFEQAKPALDALGPLPEAVQGVLSRVADVEQRVGQAPAVDRAAVEAVVKDLVIPQVLAPGVPAQVDASAGAVPAGTAG